VKTELKVGLLEQIVIRIVDESRLMIHVLYTTAHADSLSRTFLMHPMHVPLFVTLIPVHAVPERRSMLEYKLFCVSYDLGVDIIWDLPDECQCYLFDHLSL